MDEKQHVMSGKGLATAYEPGEVESKWYEYWEGNDLFKANVKSEKPAFSIVIPPPNITGSLHMGHALNNTLQDVLCRYKRMKGYNVLWQPGTDHAGIAPKTWWKRIWQRGEPIVTRLVETDLSS